jgi:hypothetical protein
MTIRNTINNYNNIYSSIFVVDRGFELMMMIIVVNSVMRK